MRKYSVLVNARGVPTGVIAGDCPNENEIRVQIVVIVRINRRILSDVVP